MGGRVDVSETCLTVAEVCERLKVNEDTVRRLFLNEPGVIVLCFPRKGRRLYRTLRIAVRLVRMPAHCLPYRKKVTLGIECGVMQRRFEKIRQRAELILSYESPHVEIDLNDQIVTAGTGVQIECDLLQDCFRFVSLDLDFNTRQPLEVRLHLFDGLN